VSSSLAYFIQSAFLKLNLRLKGIFGVLRLIFKDLCCDFGIGLYTSFDASILYCCTGKCEVRIVSFLPYFTLERIRKLRVMYQCQVFVSSPFIHYVAPQNVVTIEMNRKKLQWLGDLKICERRVAILIAYLKLS